MTKTHEKKLRIPRLYKKTFINLAKDTPSIQQPENLQNEPDLLPTIRKRHFYKEIEKKTKKIQKSHDTDTFFLFSFMRIIEPANNKPVLYVKHTFCTDSIMIDSNACDGASGDGITNAMQPKTAAIKISEQHELRCAPRILDSANVKLQIAFASIDIIPFFDLIWSSNIWYLVMYTSKVNITTTQTKLG